MRTLARVCLIIAALLPVAACVSYQEPPKPAPVVVNPPPPGSGPVVVNPPANGTVTVVPSP